MPMMRLACPIIPFDATIRVSNRNRFSSANWVVELYGKHRVAEQKATLKLPFGTLTIAVADLQHLYRRVVKGGCAMSEGLEFRNFVSFIAVAEELNFGKAAQRLHLTQPALSVHIKRLEESLGAKLFRRVPSGAELTEAGRNFLPFARRVVHMREYAVQATKRPNSQEVLTLRLGYSPFLNHQLIEEASKGYREIVPEGQISTSSDCTGQLVKMIVDGRLDAAIVTVPIHAPGVFEQIVCTDRALICLRRDDAFAQGEHIPKHAVTNKLRIMFNRDHHPHFYDYLIHRLQRAEIEIKPTETFSAPAEMQYMVKSLGCFGLVREGIPLDTELIALPIQGLTIPIKTAFICLRDQQQPVIPMLAYRLSKLCEDRLQVIRLKRSSASVLHNGGGLEIAG